MFILARYGFEDRVWEKGRNKLNDLSWCVSDDLKMSSQIEQSWHINESRLISLNHCLNSREKTFHKFKIHMYLLINTLHLFISSVVGKYLISICYDNTRVNSETKILI